MRIFLLTFTSYTMTNQRPIEPFHLITPNTLTIGTYAGFEPVCSRDPSGNARGRDIEFLKSFAKEKNLNTTFKFFPFDGIWKRPSFDEVDIAAAGISPLESRHTTGMVWSHSYYTVQRSLLIRAADSQQLKTMCDFNDRAIAVTRGTTAQLDTEQRKPASARIVYYDGEQSEIIECLLTGKIDAFAEGDICSRYMAEVRYLFQLDVVDVHSMQEPEVFAFAVREKSGGLLEALNRFIQMNDNRY